MKRKYGKIDEIDQIDKNDGLGKILSDRGTSLVQALRDVSEFAIPVEKAHAWADNPRCLTRSIRRGIDLEIQENSGRVRDFVAVSWTWAPSEFDEPDEGQYKIFDTKLDKFVEHRVRDSVLERTLRFMEKNKIDYFWIDQLCIEQQNEGRKQEAMNSMDLIYKFAGESLALLSHPIRTRDDSDQLKYFLSPDFAGDVEAGHVSHLWLDHMAQVISHLLSDPWWNRAWTFQEDYMAGTKMILAIPSQFAGEVFFDDVYIEACLFRERATEVLQAYQNLNIPQPRKHIKLLELASKYTSILDAPDRHLSSMSAKIVEDVLKRDITECWDVLAIIANICAYQVRLDSTQLRKRGMSISLCLLAQYILNGELFFVGNNRSDLLELTIVEFLRKIQLKYPHPPTDERPLTFLKTSRLPEVTFTLHGLGTHGLVLSLASEHFINSRDFGLPPLPEFRRHQLIDKPWESWELRCLARKLNVCCPKLGKRLKHYLNTDPKAGSHAAREYMNRMAWKLVEAISKGYRLRIGFDRFGEPRGIFIPYATHMLDDMRVLVAWQRGDRDICEVDCFVSVILTEHARPAIKGWMNGLTFFSDIIPERLMLGWHPSWKDG